MRLCDHIRVTDSRRFDAALHLSAQDIRTTAGLGKLRLSLTGFSIERAVFFEHNLEPSNAVYFVLDPSPWDLGGILLCNQVLQEYVTIALSSKDVTLLGSG